jgi:hypothetical protein
MRRTILAIAVGLSAIGCTSSTELTPHPLVGTWTSEVIPLNPSGTMQSSYTFSANGDVVSVMRSFGVYDSRAPREVSGFAYMVGSYRIEGTSIVFDFDRQVSWDRFYGGDSPPYVEKVSSARRKSEMKFSIEGNRVTFEYFSYPFDAPVLTRMSYTRTE